MKNIKNHINNAVHVPIYKKKFNKQNTDSAQRVEPISNTEQRIWRKAISPIIEKIPCRIPEYIQRVMLGLDSCYRNVEFSIYAKAVWDKESHQFILSEDYYLPKQIVSMAEVDYKEDNIEYNVVIHKHPSNCNSFSQKDENYINKNFQLSLLWVDGKFKTGIANIKIKDMGVRLRMKLEPEIIGLELIIPENHLEKIEELSSKPENQLYPYLQKYPNHGQRNPYMDGFDDFDYGDSFIKSSNNSMCDIESTGDPEKDKVMHEFFDSLIEPTEEGFLKEMDLLDTFDDTEDNKYDMFEIAGGI